MQGKEPCCPEVSIATATEARATATAKSYLNCNNYNLYACPPHPLLSSYQQPQTPPQSPQQLQQHSPITHIPNKPMGTVSAAIMTKREQDKVYLFLNNLHLQQYGQVFSSNRFDTVAALDALNEELLNALGILPLSRCALILSVVKKIKLA
jgi:SAM domain (Sterile alpha motif)